MQTSLRGIARKAKQDSKYKFGNLYGMLNKRLTTKLGWRNALFDYGSEYAEEPGAGKPLAGICAGCAG